MICCVFYFQLNNDSSVRRNGYHVTISSDDTYTSLDDLHHENFKDLWPLVTSGDSLTYTYLLNLSHRDEFDQKLKLTLRPLILQPAESEGMSIYK